MSENGRFPILQAGIMMLLLAACEKVPVAAPGANQAARYERIDGTVQKGPFLNGTTLDLAELTDDLQLTGKTYTTQLLNSLGNFELRDLSLASRYVQLRANGFYHNEVTGENSSAQLTLYALSDLEDQTSVNVNLLSTLEKSRIDFLLSQGSSFADAKVQAQREILAAFEMGSDDLENSERLDISQPGTGNAKLLALSVILQGYLDVADLSELVGNVAMDMREDGELNSERLGTQLVNNAHFLRPAEIRANLESRYESLGEEAHIPEFEPYLEAFIDNTPFPFTNQITYPDSGDFGPNLLLLSDTRVDEGRYSITADLPESTELKVVIGGSNWGFATPTHEAGWNYSGRDMRDSSRVFTTTRDGLVDFDVLLHIPPSRRLYDEQGNYIGEEKIRRSTFIDVYENGATEPTWSKIFWVE